MKLRILKLASWQLLLMVSLSGCLGFGGDEVDEVTVSVPNGKVFSVEEFDVEYPRSWRVLTSKDFTSDTPPETKLVFQEDVKGEFIVNVNVSKVDVSGDVSSLDYAKRAVQEQRNGLVNYKEIAREDVFVPVGEGVAETFLITFEGKVKPEMPLRRFKQLHVVNNGSAYTLTAGMRVNEGETMEETLTAMLKSFKLN